MYAYSSSQRSRFTSVVTRAKGKPWSQTVSLRLPALPENLRPREPTEAPSTRCEACYEAQRGRHVARIKMSLLSVHQQIAKQHSRSRAECPQELEVLRAAREKRDHGQPIMVTMLRLTKQFLAYSVLSDWTLETGLIYCWWDDTPVIIILIIETLLVLTLLAEEFIEVIVWLKGLTLR